MKAELSSPALLICKLFMASLAVIRTVCALRRVPVPEAGRCIKGLLDVLEGNYGGDKTRMPYAVNKEAWTGSGVYGEGI